MQPKELAELLAGKTIKEVRWHSYLGWPMCVSEIEFTDGTVVDVSGNSDEGRFDSVTLPNGEFHDLDVADQAAEPDTAKEQPNTWTQGGQAKSSDVGAAMSKLLDSEVPTSVSLIIGGEARSTLEPFLRLDGSIYSMLSPHEKDLVKSLVRTGRKLGLAVSVLTSEEDRLELATASPEQAEQILSRGNNVVSVKLSAG